MQVLNVFEQHCASRRPGLEFDRAGAAGLYDLRHMRKRAAGWRVCERAGDTGGAQASVLTKHAGDLVRLAARQSFVPGRRRRLEARHRGAQIVQTIANKIPERFAVERVRERFERALVDFAAGLRPVVLHHAPKLRKTPWKTTGRLNNAGAPT